MSSFAEASASVFLFVLIVVPAVVTITVPRGGILLKYKEENNILCHPPPLGLGDLWSTNTCTKIPSTLITIHVFMLCI